MWSSNRTKTVFRYHIVSVLCFLEGEDWAAQCGVKACSHFGKPSNDVQVLVVFLRKGSPINDLFVLGIVSCHMRCVNVEWAKMVNCFSKERKYPYDDVW